MDAAAASEDPAGARPEPLDARARLEAARARFRAPTAPALREPLPAFLPVPDRYIVLSDVDRGEFRVVALEVSEDPRALVERFNRELRELADPPRRTAGDGGEARPLSPVEDGGGLLTAVGSVTAGGVTVRITVVEYEEGGALEPAGRGAVSYRISDGARPREGPS